MGTVVSSPTEKVMETKNINEWQNQLYSNINSIHKEIINLQSLDQVHMVTKASLLLFLKEQLLWTGMENFIKGKAGSFSYQEIKYRYWHLKWLWICYKGVWYRMIIHISGDYKLYPINCKVWEWKSTLTYTNSPMNMFYSIWVEVIPIWRMIYLRTCITKYTSILSTYLSFPKYSLKCKTSNLHLNSFFLSVWKLLVFNNK